MIRTEIQNISSGVDGLVAVFGFGSFFRGQKYKDIDLVLVLSEDCKNGLLTYYRMKAALDGISKEIGIVFDLTPFTQREFLNRPLRESDQLIPLYKYSKPSGFPSQRSGIKLRSRKPKC